MLQPDIKYLILHPETKKSDGPVKTYIISSLLRSLDMIRAILTVTHISAFSMKKDINRNNCSGYKAKESFS